ncbi:exopolyphosphatase [Anaerobacillus sp. CMMVII]|uniref:exopolyphosphatase n=1 Tax=Anaerobacillus sp. CMMVII TaxID=2755588 RepID=UPI0021B81C39|nr:exopolyphosphatase [Anaerobacillus sp. CMMVII]MCT8139707.1 exopolyphosphatase [Anaerobacillus sp. CMMVII]
MHKENLALIDIGSNSIRLVIFQLDEGGYHKEVQNLKVVARLSSHINGDGNLTDQGMNVLLASLKRFQDITRTYELIKIKCVATAAIRQVKNQEAILTKITEETDFSIRILTEYEEAFYGYLAVTNSTNLKDGITIDIGGGSTEVTLFNNRQLLYYHSFPFGAITLANKFIKNEIPTSEELTQLRKFLIKHFQTLSWVNQKDLPLIGIGGSARNLALIQQRNINYPLSGLHQYMMKYSNLKEITENLITLPQKQRQSIDGLSKDRADIIIPAAEAITALMEVANAKTFIISNKGLRDGLFYEELFKQLHIDRFQNVAEESFNLLSRNYDISLNHVTYLSSLARNLFCELKGLFAHDLTKEDLRLLHLGCRALYIGEFISHEASSQHTFYLLTNLSIDGISHSDRLKIALIASFKSRSSLQSYLLPFKEWFTKAECEKIEFLGALLKFSYSLNLTKRKVFSTIKLTTQSADNIHIELNYLENPYFEENQAQKYKKHLERILKRRIGLIFCSET